MKKKIVSNACFLLCFLLLLSTNLYAQKKKRENVGKKTIQLIQTQLKKAGFDPGDLDGKFGWKTKSAIRKFQRAHKIRATGKLSRKTMNAILAVKVLTPKPKESKKAQVRD